MKASTSIWEDSIFEQCDVAIIGAGFLGQWTAYFLKKQNPKLNIHIYDKDGFGLGASSRNAGFSCFGTLGELISDSKQTSFEESVDCLIKRHAGIVEIKKFIQKHKLNIGYENIGGTEMLTQEEYEEVLEHINPVNKVLAQKLKLKKVYSTDNKYNLPFDNKYKYITNPYEGGVNSALLLQGLNYINQKSGIKIFHGMEVKKINDKSIQIETNERQIEVKANLIVVAINAFANKLINTDVVPGRGQIIWCDNLNLNFKGTFHFNKGFYYFRTIGDNQLLIGGARNLRIKEEETTEFIANDYLQNHLLDFVHNKLNIKDFSIKKSWQGIMGFSENKQPVIKEISDNVWHLHACNGMGVAMTPVIGKIFAKIYNGKK